MQSIGVCDADRLIVRRVLVDGKDFFTSTRTRRTINRSASRNADGSHIHRVPHTGRAENASFSPDGRYIVFDRRDSYHPQQSHIHVIRPNGTGLRKIATYGEVVDPSWSPDGKRIICTRVFYRNPNVSTGGDAHAPGPGPHAICEVSRKHPIPKTLYSVASGGGIGGLRWSADGQAILFSDQTLELLSRFGGAPVQITHDGYSWAPDW